MADALVRALRCTPVVALRVQPSLRPRFHFGKIISDILAAIEPRPNAGGGGGSSQSTFGWSDMSTPVRV